LRSAEEIAKQLGDSGRRNAGTTISSAKDKQVTSRRLLEWRIFRYDTESEYRDDIQADQLAGQWYANMTGLGELVPRDMQSVH